MREIETSIDPNAILGNSYVLLWIDGPIARSRHELLAGCSHFEEDGEKQGDIGVAQKYVMDEILAVW